MDKAKTVLIMGVVLTLWNLMGVYSFYHDYTMTAADIAKLPASDAVMYAKMGGWEWAVYAAGTIFGLSGAVCILFKKIWAAPLSLVSLIAVIIQFGHSLFARSAGGGWTPGAIGFVSFITLISALQYHLARRWKSKGSLI